MSSAHNYLHIIAHEDNIFAANDETNLCDGGRIVLFDPCCVVYVPYAAQSLHGKLLIMPFWILAPALVQR